MSTTQLATIELHLKKWGAGMLRLRRELRRLTKVLLLIKRQMHWVDSAGNAHSVRSRKRIERILRDKEQHRKESK